MNEPRYDLTNEGEMIVLLMKILRQLEELTFEVKVLNRLNAK